jgi:hypothetical protein
VIEERSSGRELSQLGTIVVKLRRAIDTGKKETPRTVTLAENKVHEKAKKALVTHSVRYGPHAFHAFAYTEPDLGVRPAQHSSKSGFLTLSISPKILFS